MGTCVSVWKVNRSPTSLRSWREARVPSTMLRGKPAAVSGRSIKKTSSIFWLNSSWAGYSKASSAGIGKQIRSSFPSVYRASNGMRHSAYSTCLKSSWFAKGEIWRTTRQRPRQNLLTKKDPYAPSTLEPRGHWEVDTVIGKSHKSQILKLTERTSRF